MEEIDFAAFFERIAAVSHIIRLQLVGLVASNPQEAFRLFKCRTPLGRLQTIVRILTAEDLEVSL